MVNLYIPLNKLDVFLQNVKDFGKYDDYMIDGERLGKQKLVFDGISDAHQFFIDVFTFMPNHCMLEYPRIKEKDNYILCVGKIHRRDFSYLQEIDAFPTIITKLDDYVRINAWIHHSLLEKVRLDGIIMDFSSIRGKIDEKPYFILQTQHIDTVLKIIANNSNKYIIKNNKIFVNLSLQFFCQQYKDINPLIDRLDIVDKGDF